MPRRIPHRVPHGACRLIRILQCLALVGLAPLWISKGEAMDAIRPPVLAGTWYEADPEALARSVDQHLTQGQPLAEIAHGRPIALILPHAGHRWSGDGAGQGFRTIAGETGADIERVILLGPSHYQLFHGASIPDVSAYATPLGKLPLDRDVIAALRAHDRFQSVAAAHTQEHCLEIQLPFLQRVLRQPIKIVPILVSQLAPEEWEETAALLAPHVDEHTLIVVSSDFTHYGARFNYTPFANDVDKNLRRLDKGALLPIVAGNPEQLAAYVAETGISVCGYRPIGILLELLRRADLQAIWDGAPAARVLGYYRSADLVGDFDGSVSYATVAFFRRGDLRDGPLFPPLLRDVQVAGEAALETGAAGAPPGPGADPEVAGRDRAPAMPLLNTAEQRHLLALARRAIESALRGETRPDPRPYPAGVAAAKLETPSGAFVTLTADGRLRGCIGHITAQEPLVETVIDNALSAAFRDPRFPPVTAQEVAGLEIEISVLTPLREVSGPPEIEIGRHGIVLEKAGHRAVFLPQVAPEQGWDRETTLAHLAVKAGLARDAWRSGTRFQVFEAFVFEEAH